MTFRIKGPEITADTGRVDGEGEFMPEGEEVLLPGFVDGDLGVEDESVKIKKYRFGHD